MPKRNQTALDFLLTRRSRPAKTLSLPAPDQEQLRDILTAALRTPDHGKLEPWRLIVLTSDSLDELAGIAEACALEAQLDTSAVEKARQAF
jgi:nitroreductase